MSEDEPKIIVDDDFENVQLAWSHAVAQQNLEALDQSLEALFRFCWNTARFTWGVNEFEKAVTILRTGEPVGARAAFQSSGAPISRNETWWMEF